MTSNIIWPFIKSPDDQQKPGNDGLPKSQRQLDQQQQQRGDDPQSMLTRRSSAHFPDNEIAHNMEITGQRRSSWPELPEDAKNRRRMESQGGGGGNRLSPTFNPPELLSKEDVIKLL